ncbi:type II secretion system protein M [Vibrio maerlii]|uniref:type II secretion system protein M n=1 Tax=Vibrio maerlii TaxID=2231648 RepID=UPI000E3BAB00|nr:type II secretion system protein M [Vibrio maerlii]
MSSIIAPWKEKASSWWQSISQREQRLVIAAAVVTAFVAVYWGLIQPLNTRAAQAEARLVSERQLLSWVQGKADSIVAQRGSGSTVATSNQPLNQVISRTASQYRVELIRVQPRGEMLQVWVQPLSFDQLINWLTFLQEKQGISVAFLDIEETDKPGVIEVNRLQFSR